MKTNNGFLYAMPGVTAPDEAAIKAAGLWYAFEGGTTARVHCTAGPLDCGACHILSPTLEPARLGYHPARQTWRATPAARDRGTQGQRDEGSRVCVGFYTDDPPGPEDLLRRDALPGHKVRMVDGNEYEIPVARSASGQPRVPVSVGLDENGDWTRGDVVARYADLWDLASRWWDALIAADEKAESESSISFDFAGVLDSAVTALAINYRVSKIEAAMLGLFTEQNAAKVMQATVDWPFIMDVLQKKRATDDSEASPPDGSPTVDGDSG